MATIGMRKPRKATNEGSGALGVVNRRRKTNGSSLTTLRTLAPSHVAGYACYNDGSIRDWQRHTSQFLAGKSPMHYLEAVEWAVEACRLGAGEVPSEFDQAGRTAAWPADPAAQRLPCDVRAFEVTQSDDIDERALCGVETDRSASANIERLSTEVEGACVELVQSTRCSEHRSRSPTGNRDVDY